MRDVLIFLVVSWLAIELSVEEDWIDEDMTGHRDPDE